MKRKRILRGITVVAAVMFVFSLYMIVSTLISQRREQDAFDALSSLVEREKERQTEPVVRPPETKDPADSGNVPDTDPATTEDSETSSPEDPEPTMLPEYAVVYEQNHDFYGWIRISDTPVNYPVMYTPAPNDPQFYLRRAFDKSSAQSGTPFLDGACYEGCGNLIIYGHFMRNGTMFGSLSKYADISFWKTHPTITFDTLYEHGEYEILAAFYGRVIPEDEDGFRYYEYSDLTVPEVFNEYVSLAKSAALYDTGITAEYGDELITLSTCSYHTDDGRFAVVARRVTKN